jgi:DNA-binding NarL/FixJ family response regulator
VKVYIVDDSSLLRDRLKTMLLASDGVEITGEADNPHDAGEDILRLNPDVVILDIRMPRGSGIDLIETIKSVNLFTVIIVFTDYPYRQYKKKCMSLGADYFFEKSEDFQEIPKTLEQLAQAPQRQVSAG